MAKHLVRELESLKHDISRMAARVEEVIHLSIQALTNRDANLGKKAIAADEAIDDLENKIHEDCLKILALYQPVASDLRRVCSVMLITTELERMGDLAVSIAERVIPLCRPPFGPMPSCLPMMTTRALAMVRKALDAFVNDDVHMAKLTIRLDSNVDDDNATAIAEILATMKQHPEHIEAELSMFTIVRNIEQIADHAVSIAEDVVYSVDGAILRHHHEELDKS
jgi:phosphate transport system protein